MKDSVAVVTTFGNPHWHIYASEMVSSFVQNWPAEIPLLVSLDDDLLAPELDRMLRPTDAIAIGWSQEHIDFVTRNKDRDHPTDYRKQAVRFCHKVFAIKHALEAWEKMPEAERPRYLIWLDADVLTTRKVGIEEIKKCLPREGDAVAYLGRKDWDHSECGWLAFDLFNGGKATIETMWAQYTSDVILQMPQWHDSYVWDVVFAGQKTTNLTQDKSGMEIWPQSPMAPWSRHYKGPIAKQELHKQPVNSPYPALGNMQIVTKNAVPNEKIHEHIRENQKLIKNWLQPCKPTDEEIVVVSAGPMMIPEQLYPEVEKGKRIVAVKHALSPLKEAGITPWACILLDPRDHMINFVQEPDKDILWFVASQVPPEVTKKLLDAGCQVWGYHAAVGAGEDVLTKEQPNSVVSGGSATATRGLYVLNKLLGFNKFALYGYDLCFSDKVNMDERDEMGQPKYIDLTITAGTGDLTLKRAFWTKPELAAQFQEINMILNQEKWDMRAHGHGIVPFILEVQEASNLRTKRKRAKMNFQPIAYEDLLYGRGR